MLVDEGRRGGEGRGGKRREGVKGRGKEGEREAWVKGEAEAAPDEDTLDIVSSFPTQSKFSGAARGDKGRVSVHRLGRRGREGQVLQFGEEKTVALDYLRAFA